MTIIQTKPRENPIEVSVLTLDKSPSMARTDYKPSRLEAARDAALAFVRRKRIIDGRDRTAVVAFHSSASLVAPFGRHPYEAQADLRSINVGGGTNVTAGLRLTLELLTVEAKAAPGATLRCVLLTDGEHNTGIAPMADGVVDTMRRAGVIVDTVGMGHGDALLQEIAKETGGTFVRCDDFQRLLQRYEALAAKRVTGR